MNDDAYAFIDGAAFDAALEELGPIFDATYRDIYWPMLTRNARRIFYFDALPSLKDGEKQEEFELKLKAKQEKFSFLKKVPGFHVREGFTRPRGNSRGPVLQQKGVDVALAVEVLRHTHRDNMGTARLFLSDLDFFPLLEAITDTRVISELFYRPGKTAPELIEVADLSQKFDHFFLLNGLSQSFRDIFYVQPMPPDYLDGASEIAAGRERFGSVKMFYSVQTGHFGIVANFNGNPHQWSGRSVELLVYHYESLSRTTIKWDSGWSPALERGKR